MRVLVCGGRHYDNYERVQEALWYIPITLLIHGGARGADFQAGLYGLERGIPVQVYPADWERYGKKAGYLRNKQMLEEGKPDLVVAFPGGRGTANMVQLAEAAGVNVNKIGWN